MNQTKPRFLIRRFRSVMLASLLIEAVSYIVSLTDTLVAGRMINKEALVAVGVMVPFQFIASFLASVINSGTVLGYTRAVGRFDKRHANEIFSEGILSAALTGLLMLLIMAAFSDQLTARLSDAGSVLAYIRKYYDLIIVYYAFRPIAVLLDNTVLNDGGEATSAAGNIAQTIGNVVLSIAFSRIWGVTGIALATVLSELIAIFIFCTWFLRKSNTVRIVRYFDIQELFGLSREGMPRASTYALTSCMFWMLNRYAVFRFDSDTTAVLVIVEKILQSSTLFMLTAMALQPFIGMLRAEENGRAEKELMKEAAHSILIIGVILSFVFIAFAPWIVRSFGLNEGVLCKTGTLAVRIVGTAQISLALLMLYFVYYYLIGRLREAYFICILSDMVCPAGLGIIAAELTGAPEALWIGIAVSYVIALILSAAFVWLLSKNKDFPLLIPEACKNPTCIYDFRLNTVNIEAMSETAGNVLALNQYSGRTRLMMEALIEDVLMLIYSKNQPTAKELNVECTIIMKNAGVRVILRDDGKVMNLVDPDLKTDSFRQYIVTNMLSLTDRTTWLVTNGNNRNEFYFNCYRGTQM